MSVCMHCISSLYINLAFLDLMDLYALVLLQETQKKPSVYLLIISRVRPINFQFLSQDCSKILCCICKQTATTNSSCPQSLDCLDHPYPAHPSVGCVGTLTCLVLTTLLHKGRTFHGVLISEASVSPLVLGD